MDSLTDLAMGYPPRSVSAVLGEFDAPFMREALGVLALMADYTVLQRLWHAFFDLNRSACCVPAAFPADVLAGEIDAHDMLHFASQTIVANPVGVTRAAA